MARSIGSRIKNATDENIGTAASYWSAPCFESNTPDKYLRYCNKVAMAAWYYIIGLQGVPPDKVKYQLRSWLYKITRPSCRKVRSCSESDVSATLAQRSTINLRPSRFPCIQTLVSWFYLALLVTKFLTRPTLIQWYSNPCWLIGETEREVIDNQLTQCHGRRPSLLEDGNIATITGGQHPTTPWYVHRPRHLTPYKQGISLFTINRTRRPRLFSCLFLVFLPRKQSWLVLYRHHGHSGKFNSSSDSDFSELNWHLNWYLSLLFYTLRLILSCKQSILSPI